MKGGKRADFDHQNRYKIGSNTEVSLRRAKSFGSLCRQALQERVITFASMQLNKRSHGQFLYFKNT
jgi:hypothetical protein